jgi:hypothetical protein
VGINIEGSLEVEVELEVNLAASRESKAVIPEDEPPIESQLSPEQIQQFALENNALVEPSTSRGAWKSRSSWR